MRGNPRARRAEEFHALLSDDQGAAGGADADLLELVAALRSVPPVSADPAFVSSLRTQLVAAAEREPARVAAASVDSEVAARLTPRQRRGARDRRLAAVVGGFAVVSATGSMAMASQSALPGDALYPVKRAIENAQTNLKSDAPAKADSLLSHAESRLDEAQKLAARGAGGDIIADTLEDFTEQASQASEFALDDYASSGDTDVVTDLRAFVADSMDVLGGLGPVVPSSVRPTLITASQTLRQIDAAAWEACPSCAGGDVTEVPEFATQRLSAVLDGGAPLLPASVTPASPTTPVVPPVTPPTTTQPDSTGDAPAAPTKPNNPLDEVNKTIDDVTQGVKDGVDGVTDPGGDPSQPPTTITGTLVDGVTGILGSLLGK